MTGEPDNRMVYVAYRRGVGDLIARAVAAELRAAGIPAYCEGEGDQPAAMSGAERERIAQRAARACRLCLLVLTPGTLEPCAAPGDWLRVQIEWALAAGRRIVPLVSPGIAWEAALRALDPDLDMARALAAATPLPLSYDQLPLLPAALREGLAPDAPPGDSQQPSITREQLMAQTHFERAFTRASEDVQGRIADYSEAIRLYPAFGAAYARRAANRDLLGDLARALADCDAALEHDPALDIAYINRGIIRTEQRDVNGAIDDFSRALALNSRLVQGYYRRAIARYDLKDYDGADADLTAAIALDPGSAEAYYNRGLARAQFDLNAAVEDWSEAIRLKPNFIEAIYNRGLVRANWADLDGTIEDMSRLLDLLPDKTSPQARQVRAKLEEMKQLKNGQ